MVKRKVNSKNVFDQLEHRRKTGNSGDAILRPWQQKKRKNYHPEMEMEREEQKGSGLTLKDFYANMPVGSSQFTDQIANHLKFRYTLPAGQVGGKLQKGGMSIIKGGSCRCKRK
jgi:hypothetical protein